MMGMHDTIHGVYIRIVMGAEGGTSAVAIWIVRVERRGMEVGQLPTFNVPPLIELHPS